MMSPPLLLTRRAQPPCASQLARFFHMLGKRNFPRLRSAPTFQVPLFIAAGTRSPPLVSSLSDLLNPDRIKMVALLIAFVTLWSTLTAVQAVLSTGESALRMDPDSLLTSSGPSLHRTCPLRASGRRTYTAAVHSPTAGGNGSA